MNEATEIQHAQMVSLLVKDGAIIKEELTPEEADLWHMATGVAGEAGELLDAIKKVVIYRKPVDLTNIVEELGDLEFYMERIRQIFKIQREVTLLSNIAKLQKRYNEKYQYSDEAAQARKDKE